MQKGFSFLLLLCVLSACSEHSQHNQAKNSRSIMDGEKKLSLYAQDFEPLLKLTMHSPDGYTYSCSAMHIGKGWILTAHHCLSEPIARDRRVPMITVTQYTRRRAIGPLSYGQFKYYAPKAESTQTLTSEGVSYTLQTPDLVAIKLEGQFGAELSINKSVIVATQELKKEEESKLQIAGFGETRYQRKDYGTLYAAPAYLWWGEENFFKLSQESPSNQHYAAALPGDSGGPLFLRNAQNQIVVYGVFSTYFALPMANGSYSVDNSYTRIDKGAGAAWLKLLMERI